MAGSKGFGSYVRDTWATLRGKPTAFPPSAHNHAIGDVTGLVAALAGKLTQQDLTNAINALLNGAPLALDTLKEIADRFAFEDTEQDAMLAAISVRLRFDAAQSLTSAQKLQAQANMGIDIAALTQQRAILTYTGADITWTYPIAYVAGVVPVIEALAVAPSASAALFNVQAQGDPTNVSAKFRLQTIPQNQISLLGLVNLTLFQQAPTGAKLHLTARLP